MLSKRVLFWLSSSELLSVALRFLGIICLVKFSSAEIVGIYTTSNVWAGLLALVVIFGSYNSIQSKKKSAEKVVNLIVASFSAIFLGAVLSCIVGHYFMASETLYVTGIIFLETLSVAIKNLTKSYTLSEQKERFLVKNNLFSIVCYCIGLVFLIIASPIDLEAVFIFSLIYNLSYLVVTFLCFKREVDLNVEFNLFTELSKVFKSNFAFFISSTGRVLFQNIDKLLVNFIFGHSDSGVYNVLMRLATITSLPVSVLNQKLEPRFYNNENAEALFFKSILKITSFGLCLSLVSYCAVLSVIWIFGLELSFTDFYFFPTVIVTGAVLMLGLSFLNGVKLLYTRSLIVWGGCILLSLGIIVFQNVILFTHIPLIVSLINVISLFVILVLIRKKYAK